MLLIKLLSPPSTKLTHVILWQLNSDTIFPLLVAYVKRLLILFVPSWDIFCVRYHGKPDSPLLWLAPVWLTYSPFLEACSQHAAGCFTVIHSFSNHLCGVGCNTTTAKELVLFKNQSGFKNQWWGIQLLVWRFEAFVAFSKVRFCFVGGSSPVIIMEDDQKCQV